ncbi:LCP family protein [Patescibacteria group bacterium]|nr:LCP family protein [Patescibacteria group bacterium]
MDSPKIDFNASTGKEEANKTPQNIKPKKNWTLSVLKVGLYLFMFIVILGFSLSYKVIFSSDGVFSRQEAGFFEQIKHLVTSGDKTIDGESNDRVNILLVGMGGLGHQGSYLSDTIIVASLKPSTNDVALLSIPRDLYVEIPEYGWRKINNANAFGYMEDPKKGGEWLLATVLEEILNQPIHYYATVDFSGFMEVVDLLNGVDISVDRSFTDYQYPDNNYGYDPVSFQAGEQNMDGDTALKYVRSRHGSNNEGSDFARSRRQQKVLNAIKDEIFSLGTLINPKKVIDLMETVGSHLKTDMEVWEIIRLAELGKLANTDNLINRVLDTTPSGLLYSDITIDGAYILKPLSGDYSEIQSLAKNIFNYTALTKEEAKIEVQNGTRLNGLAENTATRLKEIGFNIIGVTNAKESNLTETIIYDRSLGQKPETLQLLKKELNGKLVATEPIFSSTLSDSFSDSDSQGLSLEESVSNVTNNPVPEDIESDIVVILGSDIYSLHTNTNQANTNTE